MEDVMDGSTSLLYGVKRRWWWGRVLASIGMMAVFGWTLVWGPGLATNAVPHVLLSVSERRRCAPTPTAPLAPFPGGPNIALVAFVAREGSSWFMDLLSATQNTSNIGKICVLGFEPLEHPIQGKNQTEQEIRQLRRDFYMLFTEIENQTEEQWLAWIDKVNLRMKEARFPRIFIAEFCDWRSQLFIFKSRVANHFNPADFSPAESIWFEKFSERFRKKNGKIITITRHGMLNRAATGHRGQFELSHATSEEEIQEILSQNARVPINPMTAWQDVVQYVSTSDRVARVVRGLRAPSLLVHYESLLYDYHKEMAVVMRFLNIPYEYDLTMLQGRGTYQKASPDRLCEKVADYKSYCKFFETTKFAGLLDEACDTNC